LCAIASGEAIVVRLFPRQQLRGLGPALLEIKGLKLDERVTSVDGLAFDCLNFLHAPAHARADADFIGLDETGDFERRLSRLAVQENAQQRDSDDDQSDGLLEHAGYA